MCSRLNSFEAGLLPLAARWADRVNDALAVLQGHAALRRRVELLSLEGERERMRVT